MKRKLAFGLSVLLATCMLGACGTTDPTTVEYKGVTYDELYNENLTNLTYVEALYEYSQQGYDVDQLVAANADYGVTELQGDTVEAWAAAVEECGTYVGYDESTFVVTKSGKTVTSDITVEFSERTATFEVVYTYYNMEISGLSITTDYTLGEKMSKAALNTVISMAIVFLVLILISIIIYAFNIFPYLEKKRKEKAAASKPAETAPAAPAPAPAAEEELMDDTELIAVIAAAIAASEGTTTDGFVVRSINRR